MIKILNQSKIETMVTKNAVALSIGVIAVSLTAFAIEKKKPYIASVIFGSLGAFGLIYSLLRTKEVIISIP